MISCQGKKPNFITFANIGRLHLDVIWEEYYFSFVACDLEHLYFYFQARSVRLSCRHCSITSSWTQMEANGSTVNYAWQNIPSSGGNEHGVILVWGDPFSCRNIWWASGRLIEILFFLSSNFQQDHITSTSKGFFTNQHIIPEMNHLCLKACCRLADDGSCPLKSCNHLNSRLIQLSIWTKKNLQQLPELCRLSWSPWYVGNPQIGWGSSWKFTVQINRLWVVNVWNNAFLLNNHHALW